jgi:hypothetical protein
MFKIVAVFAALASLSLAHDHDHEQEPISGPLQKLWYNVLPGDGGTQVGWIKLAQWNGINRCVGRFGVLWHINVWKNHISSMPGK